MSLAYFTDCAVTDEAPHAENVSDDRLVVRLAEHKSDKLANRREKHHDVIGRLRCIGEVCPLHLTQLLSNVVCNIVLGDQAATRATLPVFATLQLKGHLDGVYFYLLFLQAASSNMYI